MQVTLDGLHFGGNYTAAQEMVREARAVSSHFRFFIQQTYWAPGQLRREVEDAKVGVWGVWGVGVGLEKRGRGTYRLCIHTHTRTAASTLYTPK